MKNIRVKTIFLGSMISSIIACNSNPELSKIDKEQIKKEIQAKENEFAAMYNGSEIRNIGYYAEDATTFFPNRSPLVGKKAIVEFLKTDLISNSDRLSFNTKEIFVSDDGNQVVEIGYFKLVDSATTEIINTGNYMSLFEKRDGKYVCVRDMSASDLPIK